MSELENAQWETYSPIVELIAGLQISINQLYKTMREKYEQKEISQFEINSKQERLDWQSRCQEMFEGLVKIYSKTVHEDESGNVFFPFDNKLDYNSPSHPLRRLEEAYLMIRLDIKISGTSKDNWTRIGMEMAKRQIDIIKILNPPVKKEKRGRPDNKGVSIDYLRAVWKYQLDRYALKNYPDDTLVNEKLKPYSLTDIIGAYNFALENPSYHPYESTFQHLDSMLKIKNRSIDTLLVSFNRGEKEREAMWAET